MGAVTLDGQWDRDIVRHRRRKRRQQVADRCNGGRRFLTYEQKADACSL